MNKLSLDEWYFKVYKESEISDSYKKSKEKTKINPELLSDKPTHSYNGIKVKLFTGLTTAEIMEGPDKGKWTTVEIDKLIKL